MQNKIQRKKIEKDRKIRKLAKSKGIRTKKLVKDPGIPNLWPYKQQILEKVNQKMKEDLNSNENPMFSEYQNPVVINEASALASIRSKAQQRELEYQAQQDLVSTDNNEWGVPIKQGAVSHNSKKTYYREFKKVIEASDVILEVLDARDPEGCRARSIEKNITTQYPDKKIVLILNKIDLVPQEAIKQWLIHLRMEFPTVAFKCSTQGQRSNLSTSASDDLTNKGTLGSLGTDQLLKLLKNYCRSEDVKKNITVGIIGYPNVGKSSLINSLSRSKVVGVGAKPGYTTSMQEVKLDRDINLLDCPGIVFSENDLTSDVILRNSISIEKLDDPIHPVKLILERCKVERLAAKYKIPIVHNVDDFLKGIALQRGKLKKRGVPDLNQAARLVLQDWNSGKIPFFTIPPKRDMFGQVQSDTVSWDVDDEAILKQVPSMKDRVDEEFIPMLAGLSLGGSEDNMGDEEEEYDEIEEDEEDGEEDEEFVEIEED